MEFIYMKEEEINPLLKCTVCKYPYTNPVYIPALDIRLCRLCIPQASTLINTKLDEYTSLDGNVVHMTDQLLLQLLDQLPVRCIACEKENIFRKDFSNHRLHECPKRIVLCKASDLKCSWSGRYEEYDEHLQNCTFEFLRPILIDTLTYRKQIEKYDEILTKQQNEIEELKSQNKESTADNNRIVQLQDQLGKYDELFTNQQNEIEELKNRNEQRSVENNQIIELKNQLERYDELFTNQQNQIQQLKTQIEQCEHRLGTLQNSFRIVLQETQSQKRARNKENEESVSIQRTQIDDIEKLKDQYQQLKDQLEQSTPTDNSEVVDQLNQRLDQLEQSIQKPIPVDNTEAIDELKQRLNKFENDFKQIQKQDSCRTNELSYLRQCRDKQEIQICLLARKKAVVPRSYTTIDTRIDDLIETYSKYADINLSNKRFDNQDLEAICKRAMFDKKCRKFRLENNEINAKGATIIADNLYGNLTLNELYLSDNAISDIGVHSIAQALAINNHSLTWLELHSNNINDEGVEYLSEMLKTNKTLILLGLNSNRITDRGAQILAGAITYYNDTLQWLFLASNKGITDESLDNFNDMLVNNSTLQALWLKDCGLSNNGIRKLKEIVTSTKKNFVFEV